MICCERTVKRMGTLGVRVWKMKALTVKMETKILAGKGRYEVSLVSFGCFFISLPLFLY